MFAIVVLCLVSIALAQPPRPCTSPPQWEARVFDTNEQERLTVRGRLSYDAVNHRERIIEEVRVGAEGDGYDIISLYNERVEYVYDFRAQNCTRRPLNRPWRNFAIPPDARSLGETFIGSPEIPEGRLFVTLWGGNYTTPTNDSVRQFGAWTYDHCIPVSIIRHSQQTGRNQLQFFNVTPGISNTSVFTPRPECTREGDYTLREFVFGKSPKMAKL